jgi:hypothetical protein
MKRVPFAVLVLTSLFLPPRASAQVLASPHASRTLPVEVGG